VVLKLFLALPKIHKHWGFSGGFDKSGVFFDNASGKITILNWDRCQLPLMHISSFDNGLTSWESKDRFMGMYQTYGRRIINGFKDDRTAESLFAVDKEALLNCLLECRAISRKAQGQTEDILSKHLLRYTQKLKAPNYPLDQLDTDVTLLLGTLLGKEDDKEMAIKIRDLCDSMSHPKLGKRLLEPEEEQQQNSGQTENPQKRQKIKDD
jgi:hypothetical protein